MEYIQGNPISKLPKAYELSSQDLFIISQPQNNYCLNYYYSNGIEYNDISSKTFKSIMDELDLKNMAYEDENAYSKAIHTHDYSRLTVKSYYSSGNYENDMRNKKLSVLASVYINGKRTPICCPAIQEPDHGIYIGELRMFALPNLSSIDENSKDFDGWVYPDGRKLKKEKFRNAYNQFRDTYKIEGDEDDTFRIPTLSNFIELNPYLQKDNANEWRDYQVGMKNHRHGINLKTTGRMGGKLKVYVGSSATNEHFVHKGDDGSIAGYVTDSVVRMSSDNMYLTEKIEDITNISGDMEGEQYPNYNLLPVLMFIDTK